MYSQCEDQVKEKGLVRIAEEMIWSRTTHWRALYMDLKGQVWFANSLVPRVFFFYSIIINGSCFECLLL